MKYVLYGAYGSNLNKAQMAYRCPQSLAAGSVMLKGWRLCFKGSKTGAYLDIDETGDENDIVPLGLWRVSKSDELSLDRYEGYPDFYVKRYIPLPETNQTVMVYVMREGALYGVPSMYYVGICAAGYRDFGFDKHQDILYAALHYSFLNVGKSFTGKKEVTG